MSAYGGDDVVRGLAGLDSISSGRGRDVLDGGRGGDVLVDGPGADEVYGGRGREAVNLGPGSDRVWSEQGDDYVVMRADGRSDLVRCGRGDDLVQYLEGLDEGDRFFGCERVEPYSP